MLERLLTRLHSRLLTLYPDRFLKEFGGEMGDVFAQALSGLDDFGIPPVTRRMKMARLFFREVRYFPLAYLTARRYQESSAAGETPPDRTLYGEGEVTESSMRHRSSWGEALVGALPFLFFGLAYLLDGFTGLNGHSRLALHWMGGSTNRPDIIFTAPMGVYFVSILGLLFSMLKGFPRWSYSFLGMSFYFGWYYSNGSFYGAVYGLWAWLPLVVAIFLGLLFTRSLKSLNQLLHGIWNDWTRPSFTLYAFTSPLVMIVFFDMDWGTSQLYGLLFDTVLFAAGAIAFLRSRTLWSRVLSLQAVVLILVIKGLHYPSFVEDLLALRWQAFLFILIYFGWLLMPVVIGLLRWGVDAVSSR
jgi:hypothetical protein